MSDRAEEPPIDSARRVTERGPAIAMAVGARHRAIVHAVEADGAAGLGAVTALPRWDRLTLLCHLRYGAEASLRLTDAALDGEPAAFYPGGRDLVRPATLAPRSGEGPGAVLASLSDTFARLDDRWESLSAERWATPIVEPPDSTDLGPIDLGWLALLRLTEVEVHGTDLRLGLDPWSPLFVDTALPARLGWLVRRRSNHGRVDRTVEGVWAFRPQGGTPMTVSVRDGQVDVSVDLPDRARPQAVEAGSVTISAAPDVLLAFLLGRRGPEHLDLDGDLDLAARFRDAFPPP